MTYASYSRGFKAGGINLDHNAAGAVANNPAVTPGAVPLDPTYQPEFIDGFEVGLKSEYFEHRARSNVAVFYDKISDLQVAQFHGLQFTVLSAPSAEVYGLESDNTYQLNREVRLNASVTWLPRANFGSSALLPANLIDRRFDNAPRVAAILGGELDHPLTHDLTFISNASVQYTGGHYIDSVNSTSQSPVTLLNGSVGVKWLARNVTLEAWCLNCTNVHYLSNAFSTPLQTGSVSAYVAAPLTYGLRVRGTF